RSWCVRADVGSPRLRFAADSAKRKRKSQLFAHAKILKLNVLESHLHERKAGVQLPADLAVVRQLIKVLVHGRFAVELDGDVLADYLDGVVVEVVRLERLFHLVEVGRFHHAAEVFTVKTAPIRLADVALRPRGG